METPYAQRCLQEFVWSYVQLYIDPPPPFHVRPKLPASKTPSLVERRILRQVTKYSVDGSTHLSVEPVKTRTMKNATP